MKFLSSILRQLNKLLTRRQRSEGIRVALSMCFNAILDFFSLALFLPLIVLVVNPEYIQSSSILRNLYVLLNCQSTATFIIYITIGVLAFTVLKNLLSQWITRYKAHYIFGIGSDLSQRMLSGYMEQSYLEYSAADFSKEFNRITNLPLAFANNIVMPLTVLISEGLVAITLIIVATIYDPKIFLLLIVILTPIVLLYAGTRKRLEDLGRSLKEQYPKTIKYALRVVEALPDIKAFEVQGFFFKKFKTASDDLSGTMRNEHIVQTRSSRTTETIVAVVICSIVIYSVLTSQNYSDTITLLSIYAGVSFRVFPSINRLLNASFQLRTHAYLFEEFSPLIGTMTQVTPTNEEINPRRFQNRIDLRKVSFGYKQNTRVFNNISFSIIKGEKLAIVGKSGSGKTTLLMILLQLLELNKGELLLDGEVVDSNDRQFRKLFAYVPQNPHIIDGTLAENIAFGRTDTDVEKISRILASIDLDEFVNLLPNGINTSIGEKGVQLSGGQRQRIALARALYTDAPILLFDEITNHLDSITETEILKTIDSLSKQNKTVEIGRAHV